MSRPLLLATLLAAGPAQAQTFAEAVPGNLALATSLCAQVMLQRVPPSATIGKAAFTNRSADRDTNANGAAPGLDHQFDAPAETASAKGPESDRIAGLSTVHSRHLPEAEFAALVSAPHFRSHPGTELHGPRPWTVRQDGLPLIVRGGTSGTNRRYEPPGRVQVSMSFPG